MIRLLTAIVLVLAIAVAVKVLLAKPAIDIITRVQYTDGTNKPSPSGQKDPKP